MPVRYITVTPVTRLFKPATRAFGDIAIVGVADDAATGPRGIPIPITNPDAISYSARTTLTVEGEVAANATTIPVASVFGFPPPPFNVRIGNETARVTAVTGLNLTVVRGLGATIHARDASVVYNPSNQMVVSTLNAEVNATATTIPVASVSGFPPPHSRCELKTKC